MGTARITGEIVNYSDFTSTVYDSTSTVYISESWDSTLFINNVHYPITGGMKTFEARLQKDGTFSFEIPLECSIGTGIVFDDYFVALNLTPDEEVYLRINLSNGQMKIETIEPSSKFSSDSEKMLPEIDFLISEGKSRRIIPINKPLGERTLNDYTWLIVECLNNLKKQIDSIPDLSRESRKFLFNYIKMIDLSIFMDYKITTSGYGKDSIPPKLDISYYQFLKDYDLNNSDCLYIINYLNVLQRILSNEIFAIPPIEDTPVKEWLGGVKKTMADLVDFDKGMFYDLLASNAYSRQFNNEARPLSKKQIENIKTYWKDGDIAKILLQKNGEIEKLAGANAHLNIHETETQPDGQPMETYSEKDKNLPKGKLIDSIVAKYRGKVVMVDFWATWCGPCLMAMQEMRPLKKELIEKGVVFVYITNRSFPKPEWREKITGIGGEQYYLGRDGEWESISYSKKYGFDYIPTYLIFDAEGNLKHKLTSYPGNEAMKKIISETLSGSK
ncbi:MAG: redoxin family protein [Tannerella sp.]|jgi:thiol-disulfide isomerase/thioredoxin|nr:redoxin family protein [Tannerella sp.]